MMEFKDYLHLQILCKFAEFADKAEKGIKQNYKTAFGIGNQEIQVYNVYHSECSTTAMLTSQGVWKWHDTWWGGRNYEVVCNGEEIFENFKKLIESECEDNTHHCAMLDFMRWVQSFSMWSENEVADMKELEEYITQKSLSKMFK